MANVEIRKSKIHGKGVFASRDFKKGEVVINWSDSKTLTSEELEKLPHEYNKFIYFKGEKRILVTAPARYVNHSCDPNTFIKGFMGIAKRDIKMGGGITNSTES